MPVAPGLPISLRGLRRQAAPGLKSGLPLPEIAATLGLTAGELVAAHAGVFDPAESPLKARRLRLDGAGLIAAALPLLAGGRVQLGGGSLSLDVPATPARLASLVLQPAELAHAFAVDRRLPGDRIHRGLLCFDAAGAPQIGLWAGAATPLTEFYALVRRFGATALAGGLSPEPVPPASAPAGERLADGAVWELLTRAAQTGLPLQLSAGPRAARLTGSGPVRRVALDGRWLYVQAGDDHLRLDESAVIGSSCRILSGRSGLHHRVEGVLADGATLSLADAVGMDRPEGCAWRSLVHSMLTPEPLRCAR
jgi:putative hemin transport protein